MDRIYDNGTVLLGTVKKIKEFNKYELEHGFDIDIITEIEKEIKDFNDDNIVAINYDSGMGFSIDYWSPEDIIKEVN